MSVTNPGTRVRNGAVHHPVGTTCSTCIIQAPKRCYATLSGCDSRMYCRKATPTTHLRPFVSTRSHAPSSHAHATRLCRAGVGRIAHRGRAIWVVHVTRTHTVLRSHRPTLGSGHCKVLLCGRAVSVCGCRTRVNTIEPRMCGAVQPALAHLWVAGLFSTSHAGFDPLEISIE